MSTISATSQSTANSTGTSGTNSTGTANDTGSVTKQMFLQLLVAQIKYQDPLNPTDSVQYLTQLAQFSDLEQSISQTSALGKIQTDLETIMSAIGITVSSS